MSDMLQMVVSALTEQTNTANTLQSEIAAAGSDRAKVIHDRLTDENTDDPKIKAFQEFLDKANAEIERQSKAAEEYVTANLPGADPEEIAAKTEQFKALVDSIKAARKFAATLPGATDEAFKDVPALKTLRGATAGARGTGGKRPRLVATAYRTSTKSEWIAAETEREDKEGNAVTVTNFTVLAAALSKAFKAKVEVKDLQAAAFEAAGTDDLSTLEGKPFEFAHSVGDATVFIQITPKHTDAE